ncbi:MAG: recombinase family protein, partial [Ruminiclostridium sp.]|nr:recombinase family protein [Ruminiclostridium sp.]
MGRDRLWRVGLYIRLSREDGRQESLSVQNQRKILLDFLETDFTGRWELAGEYIDDGLTGTDDSREGFQTLIGHVRAGRVNCVLCKTLSRAFRNYADQGYFLEEFFPRHRTRFIALGSPRVDSFLDPEAVQTGLEIPINGILNDRYAARTSADVRRTLDMKRRRGEFIGSFAPYGYAKDPNDKNRLIPDPEAAKVVEEIFLWYTQGLGKGAIAARLNDRGTPNPTAYKVRQGLSVFRQKNDGLWSAMTVDRILSNP